MAFRLPIPHLPLFLPFDRGRLSGSGGSSLSSRWTWPAPVAQIGPARHRGHRRQQSDLDL